MKDSDAKRSVLLFEIERERALWAIERDQLSAVTTEQREAIKHLEAENEKLKHKKHSLLLTKQPNSGGSMKSPSRFQSTGLLETANEGKKSIFVGGMSRALQQPQQNESGQEMTLNQFEGSGSELQLRTNGASSQNDASSSALGKTTNKLKTAGGARVNVISFNVSRAKPSLNNITNLLTPGRGPVEAGNGPN